MGIMDWGEINDVNYRLMDADTQPEAGAGRLTVLPGTDADLINPETGVWARAITKNLNSKNWLTESTMLLDADYVAANPGKVSSLTRYEESHNNFFADCYTCIQGTFFDINTSTRNSYGIPFNTVRFAYLIYQGVFKYAPWVQ